MRLPRYLKEERPVSLDAYGVIEDTIKWLRGSVDPEAREHIERLERARNETDQKGIRGSRGA